MRSDRRSHEAVAVVPRSALAATSTIGAAIAGNVRRRRDAAGLSLAALAELAGTSKGTVAGVESGKANPTVETVHALAIALGCTTAELLDGSPDPMVVVRPSGDTHETIGALEGRLLHRFTPTGPIELFDIVIDTARRRDSAPHSDGVYEHLWLASGRIIAGPNNAPLSLQPGDYACFPGWHHHHYRAVEPPARLLMALSLKRAIAATPPLHHLT